MIGQLAVSISDKTWRYGVVINEYDICYEVRTQNGTKEMIYLEENLTDECKEIMTKHYADNSRTIKLNDKNHTPVIMKRKRNKYIYNNIVIKID